MTRSNAYAMWKPLLTLKFKYMKQLIRFRFVVAALALCLTAASCSDNNTSNATTGGAGDTDKVDTRRNSGDTSNYLTKDSGNKSQDVIDPNPPQNSRY